jgi:hypothetical protein
VIGSLATESNRTRMISASAESTTVVTRLVLEVKHTGGISQGWVMHSPANLQTEVKYKNMYIFTLVVL